MPVKVTVEYPGVVVDVSWNLLSLPLATSEHRPEVLFPQAVSRSFAFEHGYLALDTLRNGIGFWMNFAQTAIIPLTGVGYDRDTVAVKTGWNIIGGVSCPAKVNDIVAIPPVVMLSSIVGYDPGSGYVNADTLLPSCGYWLKVNTDGSLVINGSVPGIAAMQSPVSANHPLPTAVMTPRAAGAFECSEIRFRTVDGRERRLYYSSGVHNIDVSTFELPPPPPAGVFDIRFTSQKNIQVTDGSAGPKDYPIIMQGASYPLTIIWNTKPTERKSGLQVSDAGGLGQQYSLRDSGSAQIATNGPMVLRIVSSGGNVVPAAFVLRQNYPNPFNPVTTIAYEVSSVARVRLEIYNVLGQRVVVLVDDLEEPGYKRVVWRGVDDKNSAVPSGVYFYRMMAQDISTGDVLFSSLRKMAVVK